MEKILLVEDEPSLRLALGDTLADEGFFVRTAADLAEAMAALGAFEPDLVLSDLRLPDGSGLELLSAVGRDRPGVPFILLTAYGTVATAVEAIRSGAAEFLTKPFENAQVLGAVRRHLELRRLRRRVAELEGGATEPIGDAPSFRRAVELARTVARSESTVMLLGETGTGKELFARLLHDHSPRRGGPFVPVNCAALPETLLESELFGHERGAFTGALRQRRGRFEEADGGTLFLDEIAETSPQVQAKLLRAIETQTFERLGSSASVSVNVRLVVATRRRLEEEVAAGRFRDDLYYRLKVIPIEIPPLRERPGDIELLAHAFARRCAARLSRRFELSPEAVECLSRFPFPGNVRELEHLVQRLSVVCADDMVLPDHLPPEYRCRATSRLDLPVETWTGNLAEMAAAFERKVLQRSLEQHQGHRARTAASLGISRKNLWEKLRQHGLADPERDRGES